MRPGWRPTKDDLDRYGRAIPDDEYQTKDFERVVALRARTQAIAKHLTEFLKKTDRYAKTIVFCVDQEHASEMRAALSNLNSDLAAQYPDYVCRVTADEGDIGRGHLSRFQDVDTKSPTILTTSQLLTTGVDAPTCKNVVLARVVGSMTEFKQIIGRGTRVRDDYGKLWFNIIDYTGSATRMFADPDFDGDPAKITEEELKENGETTSHHRDGTEAEAGGCTRARQSSSRRPRNTASSTSTAVRSRSRPTSSTTSTRMASNCGSSATPTTRQRRSARCARPRRSCVQQWADPVQRSEIIRRLAERGISFEDLAEAAKQPDADPFDLLCHLAFNAPLRTRRERAQQLRETRADFFDRYGPEARQILEELLEKYAVHGDAQFVLPDVLKVPPLSAHGQVGDIIALFGGADQLRACRDRIADSISMPRKSKDHCRQLAPTTAQSLGSLLKSARDIMRKDKGLNGDLDRLPLLTWIMFLKFLDDLELQREEEAKLAGKKFRPAIEPPYRWRDWAANPQGVTGDELLAFINQDECTRPDGKRGPGLFAYLRRLTSSNGDDRRDVIATVFKGVDNRMK